MQDKDPQREALFSHRDQTRKINRLLTLFAAIFIATGYALSEEEDRPYSAYFFYFALFYLFRSYNQTNNQADELIIEYDAQQQASAQQAKVTEPAKEAASSQDFLTQIANLTASDPSTKSQAQSIISESLTFASEQQRTSSGPLLSRTALELEFRQKAQLNDVARLKEIVAILGNHCINLPGTTSGKAALHFAVNNGSDEAAKYLLEQNADINLQDNDGNTPVHNAIQNVINKKKNAYPTLLALISYQEKAQLGTLIINDFTPPTNYKINPTLTNKANKNILDLIDKVPNRTNAKFVEAKGIIERIWRTYHQAKSELGPKR